MIKKEALLREKKEKASGEIERMQEMLANYDQRRAKVDPKEYKEVAIAYQKQQAVLNRSAEKEEQLESLIIKVIKEEEELNQQLQQLNADMTFREECRKNLNVEGTDYPQKLKARQKEQQ